MARHRQNEHFALIHARLPEFPPEGRQRVVVLGGGFGGAYCARALEKELRGIDVEIILIDMNNYLLFYPLIFEAGIGDLEPRHCVVPLRDYLGERVVFRMARVITADLKEKTVIYRLIGTDEDRKIHFDHMVFALGSVTRLPGQVKGLRENAYEMKELADAVALRDNAIRLLEVADHIEDAEERRKLLHFVVVGGNYTGVEIAGEYHNYLRETAERYYRTVQPEDIQTTLFELSDRILPQLDPTLSAKAVKGMEGRGIRFQFGTSLKEVHEDRVITTKDETIWTRTVVWAAGIAPSPLVKTVGFPTDARGWILCEKDGRIVGHDSVWAIGDSASNPNPEGIPYPPTAQHATRQGKQVAANIRRTLRGELTQPVVIKAKGSLAALGNHTAVAEMFGLKLSGKFAWILWRSVYWMLMPKFSRKARVGADWFLGLLFGKDYAQLGIHRAQPIPPQATGPKPDSVTTNATAEKKEVQVAV